MIRRGPLGTAATGRAGARAVRAGPVEPDS